jgi:hypothetical protein
MEPTWSNFPDFLIERFPQLKESVEESYFDWRTAVEDPTPYVFLNEILGPLLLTDGTREHADLSLRAGEVLDELLTCSDYELAEAALTSIVEVLRDSDELRANAWRSLGTTAREWLIAAQHTRRTR